jgi:HD-GYP domain-containing protein (c-di-GMP phosphodiesterase class II)
MEESLIRKILQQGAGTQFDPRIVSAFQKAYGEGKISRPFGSAAAA